MCRRGATACALEAVALSVDLRKGDDGRERQSARVHYGPCLDRQGGMIIETLTHTGSGGLWLVVTLLQCCCDLGNCMIILVTMHCDCTANIVAHSND